MAIVFDINGDYESSKVQVIGQLSAMDSCLSWLFDGRIRI